MPCSSNGGHELAGDMSFHKQTRHTFALNDTGGETSHTHVTEQLIRSHLRILKKISIKNHFFCGQKSSISD